MENKYFLRVNIGDRQYEALSTLEQWFQWLIPELQSIVEIEYSLATPRLECAIGGTTETVGILNLNISLDGHSQQLNVKVLNSVTQDIILRVDFYKVWKMDVQLGPGLWRVFGGDWHKLNREEGEEGQQLIFAECAAISALTSEQRDIVQEMVNRLVIPASEELGVTKLTEHNSSITDETSVQHRQRRMSPIMISWAQKHVGELYR